MKKLAIALSGASVVAGITAAMLWTQLSTEREQLAGLRTRVTELEAAQTAVLPSATPAVSPTTTAVTPESVPATPSSSPGAAPGATPGDRLQRGVAKGLADVLSSPEGNDLIRNQVRAALAQQFPDLASELRLTPAEADKFMDLLARQASGLTGDALGMLTGSNGAAGQEAQRKMLEKQLESEKEIARTLGNKYPAWQEYQGTATARQQISQLRSLLGSGPDALTETQSKPLIAALGSEQARINKEEQSRMSTAVRSSQPINMLEDQLKSMTAHNERLVSTASSHLSSNQLDGYKRMLKQQEDMVRAIVGSMNQQKNAGGQAGAPR
jgi:hypothetical protein